MRIIKRFIIISLLITSNFLIACSNTVVDNDSSLESFIREVLNKQNIKNKYHTFWDEHRTIAVIVSKKSNIENQIYLVFKNNMKKYTMVNISLIEEKNLMAISIKKRNLYSTVSTIVTQIEKDEINSNLRISVKTVASTKEKTKSYMQFLIVKQNGQVLWR